MFQPLSGINRTNSYKINPILDVSGPYVPAACLTVNKKIINFETGPNFFLLFLQLTQERCPKVFIIGCLYILTILTCFEDQLNWFII